MKENVYFPTLGQSYPIQHLKWC